MENKCDFSPLKTKLKGNLERISEHIGSIVASLEHKEVCLLNEIDMLSREFMETESLASTYYLNCFLSPFTNKYNEISRTIHHLSMKRVGALIVIQRNDSLEGLITPGISLAAAITSPLLESIFIPGSPLHDGAVVVSEDLIVSAANVLPLTSRSSGGKKLGTRHRAAIGLSERCDALVIVVSEESGQASFCVDGKIYPVTVGAEELTYS